MRSPGAPALLSLLLAGGAGCEPLTDPNAPDEQELPCRRDDDCEIRRAESRTRQSLCTSQTIAPGSEGARYDVLSRQAVACGEIPSMGSRVPEPDLACFRGTCVPIGSRR